VSDDLDRRKAELAAKEASTLPQFESEIKAKSDTRNRDLIVKCVVLAYVSSIVAIMAYLLFVGFPPNANSFQNMSEILKIGVIPIVTLVIGHYFGSKST
jgi:sterol desaturase/sphingolipid hydroxylase (fatty acid hydroxylase superfamily)